MTLSSDFISGLIVGIITSLFGAVVGVLLVATWDLWKDRRLRAEQHQKATRILQGEIVANMAFLERNREHLTKDIDLAKEQREIVVPLNLLSTRAWESVHIQGTLSPDHSELLKELEQTYISVSILNQRIQARELYRIVSQAMSNYHQRRVLINQDLLTATEKLLLRFQEHRQALR